MTILSFDCRHQYPAGFRLELSFETDQPITALIGPSGSGKTTTLHLIAGILRSFDGRICVNGKVFVDHKKKINLAVRARRVGLVFQDYQLFPHLTVEQNLKYGNLRTGAKRVSLSRIVEVLKLQDLLTRYPRSLSGGEAQRVAIGRAIASEPELLLLDEPVSALDQTLKQEILRYLKQILDEYQIPALLVTHDLDLVTTLAAHPIQMPLPAIANPQL